MSNVAPFGAKPVSPKADCTVVRSPENVEDDTSESDNSYTGEKFLYGNNAIGGEPDEKVPRNHGAVLG